MSTVVANSGGPGSSITLDPEIVSMRDRYLKALEGKPFDEMNLLIQKQLETEGEDIKRLSLLAARVYILRLRTLELRDEPIGAGPSFFRRRRSDASQGSRSCCNFSIPSGWVPARSS